MYRFKALLVTLIMRGNNAVKEKLKIKVGHKVKHDFVAMISCT